MVELVDTLDLGSSAKASEFESRLGHQIEESEMWILYVMSLVSGGPDAGELKYTKYDTYNSLQKCEINKAVIETSFLDGEYAVCIRGQFS